MLFMKRYTSSSLQEGGLMEIVLQIDGISCEHCVTSITNGVKELPGVSDVSLSLENKTAHVSFTEDQSTKKEIIRVIEDLGYKIKV
jgi:copper ion binding protein